MAALTTTSLNSGSVSTVPIAGGLAGRSSNGLAAPIADDTQDLSTLRESVRPIPANDVESESRENSDTGFTLPKEPPAQAKLSEVLWPNWIPSGVLKLDSRITAHPASEHETAEFLAAHFDRLFPSEDRWYRENAGSKTTFLKAVADMFLLRDGTETIGVFIGNPVDWSTYYVRLVALLPSHQNQSVCVRFVQLIASKLEDAGVERIEAEAAPSNVVSTKVLLGLGFQASGTVLSERWGALCRWTLHLSRPSEAVFVEQFCFGGRVHRDAYNRRKQSGLGRE